MLGPQPAVPRACTHQNTITCNKLTIKAMQYGPVNLNRTAFVQGNNIRYDLILHTHLLVGPAASWRARLRRDARPIRITSTLRASRHTFVTRLCRHSTK